MNDLVVAEKGKTARELWHAERLTGIGSSDAAAVAGVSPWRTPVEVWLEKTQQVPVRDDDEDSGPTYWGRRLEPIVLDEYRIKTGCALGHRNELIRNKERPFMLATVDAIGIPPSGGGPRPVEAKTTRWQKEWGEPETDQAPLPYVFQVQHQLAVTGYNEADIAVLIGGSDFRIYRVQRDEEIIKALIRVESEFWQCVENRVPPPMRSLKDAATLYPKHTAGLPIEADEAMYKLWVALCNAKMDKKAAELEVARNELLLKDYMKQAEVLMFQGDVLATWRTQSPRRIVDTKKLQLKQPGIYLECLKETKPPRVFLTKIDESVIEHDD